MKKLVSLFCLFIPAFSLFSQDKEFFAIATFVKGEAYYVRKSVETKIKPRTILLENDIIQTKKGSVDLQVGPNTTIRVNSYSKLKLTQMDLTDKKQLIGLNLESGQLYGKAKKLPKGSKIQIQTPTVTGGVRGTEFAIAENSSPDTPPEEKLEDGVYVTEGSVGVKRNDSPKEVVVEAGQELLTKSKEMIANMLSEHNQKKLEILETIKMMKEENYRAVEEQREKNKNTLKKPWFFPKFF